MMEEKVARPNSTPPPCCCWSACIFIGLPFTSASRLQVFLDTAPFAVALVMPLIWRNERLAPTQVPGLAVAGVVWAFAGGFSKTV